MTFTTLIALNAVLGALVVGGLLVLLVGGILRDRDSIRVRKVVELIERTRHERLAA